MVCPVCGQEGVVEQRGNSVRIVHYSWMNGKRVFMKHTVKNGNGGNSVWEQKTVSRSSFMNAEPRAGFDPATYGLQGRCSTTLSYRGAVIRNLKSKIKALTT